jgi:hemerythrin-like domain-containing protein
MAGRGRYGGMGNRRRALVTIPALVVMPVLSGCSGEEEEVGAVEDLMREHGILRRAILVFRESATRIRAGQAVDAMALQKTAELFREFGEEYHEKKLEEANIFPALRKAGGEVGAMVDVLVAQHNRGREIITYVLSASRGPMVNDARVAGALESFERMYAHHAAREDTVIFPAWKKAIGEHAVNEMGETFEDIEKKQFGGDGFDKAVKRIGDIEQTLGMTDLAQFTAPGPA